MFEFIPVSFLETSLVWCSLAKQKHPFCIDKIPVEKYVCVCLFNRLSVFVCLSVCLSFGTYSFVFLSVFFVFLSFRSSLFICLFSSLYFYSCLSVFFYLIVCLFFCFVFSPYLSSAPLMIVNFFV